jgi:recombinational DNA repair ATPase RecF
MKKRITKIEIENYRAFYALSGTKPEAKPYTFSLPKGENLLIYGENGSGKTSFYHALKDYFEAKDIGLKANWFGASVPDIALTFSDFNAGKLDPATTQRFPTKEEIPPPTPPPDPADKAFIAKINLAKGFFSYRELLATHLDNNESGEFDLFSILVERVLHNYISTGQTETLSALWDSLKEQNAALIEIKAQNPQPDADIGQTISEATETLERETITFQDRLEKGLELLEGDTNTFNQYFKHGIKITFDVQGAAYDTTLKQLTAPQIFLKVTYNGFEVTEHHQYLNEARLSALAISLFLASVLNNPTKEVLNLLFLDDIFLGLDTGNRLPLLDILKDAKFEDFQIFMTTYDRAWFELVKDHLSVKWKSVEMYAQEEKVTEHPDGEKHLTGSIEHPPGSNEYQFEKPLIIDPSLGYLEKAGLYFTNKDYPAAGNALRRACEKILKSYLPEGYLLSKNGELLELGNLLSNITEYFEDAGQEIPRDVLNEIIFFKNALFNPSSHHDLRSNFYRGEIERAIAAVEKLRNLPKISWTPVLHPCQEFEFENTASNFKAKILIGDYIYKTKFDGNESISKMRFYIDWWEKDGIEFWNRKTNLPHTDKEIAGISTKPHSLDEVSSWLARVSGTAIVDIKAELILLGNSLSSFLI